MRRLVTLFVIFVLTTITIAAGQNDHPVPTKTKSPATDNPVLITARPGTANDNGDLHFWCQLGPPGTGSQVPFTAFIGPVPITITGAYGVNIWEEGTYNPYSLPGDFFQGECLALYWVLHLTFSQGVSQVGAQVMYDRPNDSHTSITVYGSNGLTIGDFHVIVPGDNMKEDGSASYFGVEDLDSNGNPTPGIFGIEFGPDTFRDPYLINGLSITVPNAPGCYAPPNTTMVAWYPFDEPSPLTTSSNIAAQNPGLQVNGPLGITQGEVAGAASFNGNNQYVESPSTIATNFGPATLPANCTGPGFSGSGAYSSCQGDFSIDTWINIPTTAPPGIMVILDKRAGSPPTMQAYAFFVNNGFIGIQLADGLAPSPGYTNYYSSASVPYDGNWHHVAVTVKRTVPGKGITWYYDGQPVGNSDPTDRKGSLVNSSPLRIGTRTADDPLSGWFQGGLDELEIYNRKLTDNEVFHIFDAHSVGKCKSAQP